MMVIPRENGDDVTKAVSLEVQAGTQMIFNTFLWHSASELKGNAGQRYSVTRIYGRADHYWEGVTHYTNKGSDKSFQPFIGSLTSNSPDSFRFPPAQPREGSRPPMWRAGSANRWARVAGGAGGLGRWGGGQGRVKVELDRVHIGVVGHAPGVRRALDRRVRRCAEVPRVEARAVRCADGELGAGGGGHARHGALPLSRVGLRGRRPAPRHLRLGEGRRLLDVRHVHRRQHGVIAASAGAAAARIDSTPTQLLLPIAPPPPTGGLTIRGGWRARSSGRE